MSQNKSIREQNEHDISNLEREEDLLEMIYVYWQEEREASVFAICRELKLTKWEYNRISARMVAAGFLDDSDKNQLRLTQYGKTKAQETLQKHHYIATFLKMTCNVEEEVADENACRIEHVISDEVLCGVREFIRTGKTPDRVIEGEDLNVLYKRGRYEFEMSMYEAQKRYPRVLCREFQEFSHKLQLEVGEQSSVYLQWKDKKVCEGKGLSYFYRQCWYSAPQTPKGYRIPSKAVTYTICGEASMIEGDLYIAIVKKEEAQQMPREEQIRELNVHLW